MLTAILNSRQDCSDGEFCGKFFLQFLGPLTDNGEAAISTNSQGATQAATSVIPTPISTTIPSSTVLSESIGTQRSLKVVVTATLMVASTADLEPFPSATSASEAQTSQNGSSDTKTVLVTVGCVGGFAILVLLIYWIASHVARRRYYRQKYVAFFYLNDQKTDKITREQSSEEGAGISSPMLAANLESYQRTPMLLAPSHPSLNPLIPKAAGFERRSNNPYNTYLSGALDERSSIHPGTKVLFGKVGRRLNEVPARKPVPGSAGRQTLPTCSVTENTESIWSDDSNSNTSTVLGDTGRAQHKPADVYHPLPPGRSIVSWLGGGGFQRPSSAKKSGNGSQRSNSGKSRPEQRIVEART